MIELSHATFTYEGSSAPALRDFSLRVDPGECVVLCGKSGCGKSTALRLVNGMIPNFYDGVLSGSVSVAGKDPFECEIWELAGVVGAVFQNPRTQFYATDTTSEVAFGCENMGLSRREIARRVDEAFAQTGMAKLRNRSIFDLSGGEKQAIAFASVSAMSPSVYVLDEPSSNLDLRAIEALGAIVAGLKRQGATILVAEHRLGYLYSVADRAILIEGGKPVCEMSLEDVGRMGREDRERTGLRPLRSKLSRAFESRAVPPRRSTEQIVCADVGFSYRKAGSPALDIDHMNVRMGSVTAILGRNGAGKSTFSRCLAGLIKPSRGKFFGRGRPLSKRERLAMSYVVMQDVNHQLFCPSVREEVLLSIGKDAASDLKEVFRRLDLEGLEDRHPMSLSGGQKQRVAIASALVSKKKVLIFDEPTSGLDYSHMLETARLFQAIADNGMAVLVVTHDMDLVAECCDFAVVLEEGNALREGPIDAGFLTWAVEYLRHDGALCDEIRLPHKPLQGKVEVASAARPLRWRLCPPTLP